MRRISHLERKCVRLIVDERIMMKRISGFREGSAEIMTAVFLVQVRSVWSIVFKDPITIPHERK